MTAPMHKASLAIALTLLLSLPAVAAERDTLRVQGSVYVVASSDENSVVQVGNQGVLVVNSGTTAAATSLLGEIGKIAQARPIRFIVSTSADADDIGGNAVLRESGAAVFGGNVTFDDPRGPIGATVLGHENVNLRLAESQGGSAPADRSLWPTETFSGDSHELFFNEEAVRLLHMPAAHSDGDLVVFFRRSDVIATGAIFSMTSYPVIDVRHGGTIKGEIAALNRILEIAVPGDKEEGGTLVIPGRGRLCDQADVVEYRDMVTIIRDRIEDMKRRGLSLKQVQSQRPTSDYDGRFGVDSGPWTTQNFVEAIYQTL